MTWASALFFMFLAMRNAARCEHISAAMYSATDSTVKPTAIQPLWTIPVASPRSG